MSDNKNAIAKREENDVVEFVQESPRELLRAAFGSNMNESEFALFASTCDRTGLDPYSKQIYAIKRWDTQARKEVVAMQVSIDGLRAIAASTGEYAGARPTKWCGPDGRWVEFWDRDEPPAAAMVEVISACFKEPLRAVATWREYAQRKKDGSLISMWKNYPSVMLAKCAEALALRRAFPKRLSGLYTADEIPDAEYTTTAASTTVAEVKQLPEPNLVDLAGISEIEDMASSLDVTDAGALLRSVSRALGRGRSDQVRRLQDLTVDEATAVLGAMSKALEQKQDADRDAAEAEVERIARAEADEADEADRNAEELAQLQKEQKEIENNARAKPGEDS